jgi:hypothetical protein
MGHLPFFEEGFVSVEVWFAIAGDRLSPFMPCTPISFEVRFVPATRENFGHQKEIPLMTKLLQMHSNSNRWQQAI